MIDNFTSSALGGNNGVYGSREIHTKLMDGWECSELYQRWFEEARDAGGHDTLAFLSERIVDNGEHYADHQYVLTQEWGKWQSAEVCMRLDVEVHHGHKGDVGALAAVASEVNISEGGGKQGTYIKLVLHCTNTEHKKHRRVRSATG